MSEKRIVLLAGPDESTRWVFHALDREFDVAQVIVEEAVPRARFLKNRAKRLGWTTVAGQALFRAAVAPCLRGVARARIAELKEQAALSDAPLDPARTVHVASANADEVTELLRELQPAAVVLNGTRIIAKRVLESVPAPFLNIHAGITPQYRGVHGGYWALAQNDREHCGVTVHFVDAGVDTGGAVAQAPIAPTRRDNFITYPLLQAGAGIPLLVEALKQLLKDGLKERAPSDAPSKLWSHPTLWGYLWRRLRQGVK